MIFEGRGFVNLQLPNPCTSGFGALFALTHVKTREISPVLNERMTYKVFGRQGLASLLTLLCIGRWKYKISIGESHHSLADQIPHHKTRPYRGHQSSHLAPLHAHFVIHQHSSNPTEEEDDYECENRKPYFFEDFRAGVFGPFVFADDEVSEKDETEEQGYTSQY